MLNTIRAGISIVLSSLQKLLTESISVNYNNFTFIILYKNDKFIKNITFCPINEQIKIHSAAGSIFE